MSTLSVSTPATLPPIAPAMTAGSGPYSPAGGAGVGAGVSLAGVGDSGVGAGVGDSGTGDAGTGLAVGDEGGRPCGVGEGVVDTTTCDGVGGLGVGAAGCTQVCPSELTHRKFSVPSYVHPPTSLHPAGHEHGEQVLFCAK